MYLIFNQYIDFEICNLHRIPKIKQSHRRHTSLYMEEVHYLHSIIVQFQIDPTSDILQNILLNLYTISWSVYFIKISLFRKKMHLNAPKCQFLKYAIVKFAFPILNSCCFSDETKPDLPLHIDSKLIGSKYICFTDVNKFYERSCCSIVYALRILYLFYRTFEN